MKPYWFKLTENDEPISTKPKTHRFLTLLIGVLIGVVGTYLLIPSKVADSPVDQISIVEPTTNLQPTIKNPMLNPSNDDEEEDEDD